MIIAIDYDLGLTHYTIDTSVLRFVTLFAVLQLTIAAATSQNRYTSPYDVTPDFNREIKILHLLVFFA